MPSRAFLLFGRAPKLSGRWRNATVSMPSRAFLLFGHFHHAEGGDREDGEFQCPRGHFCFSDKENISCIRNYLEGFQCPRGHFCFSDKKALREPGARFPSFNALAGIFAFRTRIHGQTYIPQPHEGFQCPRGHFCFSDSIDGTIFRIFNNRVSMPSRAFLLFGPLVVPTPTRHVADGFNALAGIFAFRTVLTWRARRGKRWKFQCPRGHFCFSDVRLPAR